MTTKYLLRSVWYFKMDLWQFLDIRKVIYST